jgi:hypothetical protein
MNSLINSSSEYHVNPHGAWEKYFYVASILFFNQGQFLFYILCSRSTNYLISPTMFAEAHRTYGGMGTILVIKVG